MIRRRYYKRKDDDSFSFLEPIMGFGALYFGWIILLYYSDRAAYWRQLWYFIAFLVVITLSFLGWEWFKRERKIKKVKNLVDSLKNNGLEEYLNNFISRFGVSKDLKNHWNFREHSFDWARLEDLRFYLNEKGMKLSINRWDDTLLLLKHYIQEREEKLTRESIAISSNKFNNISGSDFENLLYRLFTARGYSVQRTGKTGDQGGDLIVNMGGERIVVQAKRYSNSVGNAAVQQASAAQKFYDCNQAMVVTNSFFTKEAIDLAKANNVKLISGGELSRLILEHLKENWI